jgi:hypothetical protein
VIAWTKDGGNARMHSFSLGRTDPEGMASGSVEGGGKCDLEAMGELFDVLAEVSVDIDLPPGGRLERTIELHTGTLVVELPAGLEPPAEGGVSVRLKRSAGDSRSADAMTPGLRPGMGGLVWRGRILDFGEVEAGEFEATVDIYRYEQDPLVPGTWGITLTSVPMRAPFVKTLRIDEGRQARIVVP